MSQRTRAARGLGAIGPSTSSREAAAVVLRPRLDAAVRLFERALSDDESPTDIHQLRVGSRRASAALEALATVLPEEPRRKALRKLKKVRRAAAAARDCDVHLEFFARLTPSNSDERAALRALRSSIREARRQSHDALTAAAAGSGPSKLRKLKRQMLDGLAQSADARLEPDTNGVPFAALARAAMPACIERVASDIGAGIETYKALHDLRISLKKCRYALEVFKPALGERGAAITARLKDAQTRLGDVNDRHAALERLRRFRSAPGEKGHTQEVRRGLVSLAARLQADREKARSELLAWWRDQDPSGLVQELESLVGAAPSHEFAAPRRKDPANRPTDSTPLNGALPAIDGSKPSVRLAAIDIGSNSARLIIAEAQRSGAYRILDDEKEQVRLGRGLASTGAMDRESILRTIEVVSKMKSIAQGYGVDAIRMIATAAVREAANRDELIRPLEKATGLPLTVISADEEAKLAYESAAHYFDLSSTTAAVMDIGGGSMEVVLSSNGAVEHSSSMPLGAVRLTEKFGGPESAAGERFDDMRRYIDAQLDRHVGKPPFTPQVLIGAGGTISTLANVSLHQRRPEGDLWLSAAGVRGHEMLRSEVRHLLDYLRKLPVRERARTPGLPAERADIIVAGLAAVERLMKKLGVNRVRVHDGGIREGIILRMIAELLPGAARSPEPRDPLAAARKFATACAYEERHCNHVAALAARIFDQLASRPQRAGGGASARPEWTDPRNRTLLEAAAILKDIGYHINYSKHHHHSYHLIMHGDFRGLPARDIELIANVARYHRRAEPKAGHPNFAKLSASDRDIVRRLSAILRIADGLDRTHMGHVRDVSLVVAAGEALFLLDAESSPSVEVWGAERKAGLFEKVFGIRARFDWASASSSSAPKAESDAPSAAAPRARKPRPARKRTHAARRVARRRAR